MIYITIYNYISYVIHTEERIVFLGVESYLSVRHVSCSFYMRVYLIIKRTQSVERNICFAVDWKRESG